LQVEIALKNDGVKRVYIDYFEDREGKGIKYKG
jgi:hypothetical protein